MKTVRLCWDKQFIGDDEIVVKLPDTNTERIRHVFEEIFGFPFDEDCWYEIIDDNKREVL